MKPLFVLDCSLAVSWLLGDEASPASDLILGRLQKGTAAAPPIWELEVANALVMAERRRRIDGERLAVILRDLSDLPVVILQPPAGRITNEILILARETCLTVYDACYLDLAMREGLPLATNDAGLIRAAARAGVKTITSM